ncbi:MAG: SDR family NAD(P)-dependent oxidoreductase [Gaiellales bacterium]
MSVDTPQGARLAGRVAVVTGGGRGIGEAICNRLATDGAAVVVLDVDEGAAELVAARVGGSVVIADVADSAAIESAARQVTAEHGGLDIWVNNAGVPSTEAYRQQIDGRAAQRLREAETGDVRTPLDALVSVDDTEWRRMIDIHLSGTFHGMRAAARVMSERRSGAIVNISSICGIVGCEPHPHYSAAKAGIIGLTRATARELIGVGIRVNVIAPGYVDTIAQSTSPDVADAIRASVPAKRLGHPAEIAAAVSFLVSDEASYVVGQVISPNGGIVTA